MLDDLRQSPILAWGIQICLGSTILSSQNDDDFMSADSKNQ